jgi:hypothetical protein
MEYGKAGGYRQDLSFSLNNKNSAYSSLSITLGVLSVLAEAVLELKLLSRFGGG